MSTTHPGPRTGIEVAGSSPSQKVPAARPRRRRNLRVVLFCFALVAPVVLIRVFTAGYPMVQTAVTSLQNDNPTQGPATWAGFDNYTYLAENPQIQGSLFFTAVFAVVSTLLEIVIGLALAVLLNQKFRFRRLARAVNLLPWAIPAVVAGVAFKFALDPQYGVIAGLLNLVGFDGVSWLSEVNPARVSVIGVNVWRNAGFVAVLLLAALQTIPGELYEAAQVDGANAWGQFRRITLPLVMPVVLSAGMFMLIWQVASFDLVLAMTGGGPGTATSVLGYSAYVIGFQNFNFGRSAAVAMVLLVFVCIIGTVFSLARRRYEK
ncbi:ABC transporter permease subunit [Nakamurella sp. YIM 132087]|uniref:ABC transporter permease subunit n=1 Tax=Nakamurella alba TaxID=2665158 RepID=A0A7K1FJC9_9ACTN|nr:sugar ABC transporter permease [Nakamurella alba]MTD13363.1 ABC transporter permease subunit [Nakamurella alba]